MGVFDTIKSIGIPTGDSWNTGSDGNGDIFADTKGYQPVDPATKPEISAPDESAKYAGNVADWSQSNAYWNNEYAYEVAQNYLFIKTSGTNTIAGENNTKLRYMEQGAGHNLYSLA